MTPIATRDIPVTDPARATMAAGWPQAARWPDGTFTRALLRTGAPSGEAQ